MAIDGTSNLYMSIFGKMVYKEYRREKEPMNLVFLPRPISGTELFSEDDLEEIYQRCLRDNKPWQEMPDIVDRVKNWYRDYERGIKEGEIY